LEASNHQSAAKIHELKAICADSVTIQENYRQSCIEIERVLGEMRAVEEARKVDKDQIANLTEKTSFLVWISLSLPSFSLLPLSCVHFTILLPPLLQSERVNHFEKLSNDLTTKLSKATESQLQQQQIAETSQRLSVKLQGTVDNQLRILETLRVSDSPPASASVYL
jgi:hypothetical protein